jgi:hypothetical protein
MPATIPIKATRTFERRLTINLPMPSLVVVLKILLRIVKLKAPSSMGSEYC